MTSEWDVVTIKEITSKLGDGLHGTPTYSENGEYYFINGNNLCDGRIVFDEKTKRCDAKEFEKYQKPLDRRTILVSINGTLGNVAYYKDENVILGKSACYFNLKEGIEKRFVGYIVSSSIFQRYLEQIATGTTIKNVSLKSMREFSFKLPSAKEQKAIASVLGALDDKIENNRRMNETLEEMARAIFKSWFVDFDPVHAKAAGNSPAHMDAETAALFPSSFSDDGLPTGWRNGYLKDYTNIVYGKSFPTKELITSGYPVFGGNGVIGFHSNFLYEEPQVLVACRGAASGKVIRSLPFSFVTNNSLVVEIKDQQINRFFLELYLRDLTLEGFTTGSAQPQMTIANMDAVKILLSKKDILDGFESVAEPLFDKVLANDKENQTLAELRDTLLPKLMSGEIRVKDVEATV